MPCWAPKQLVAAAPGRLDPSLGSRRFLNRWHRWTKKHRFMVNTCEYSILWQKAVNESLHKGWPGQVAKLDCAFRKVLAFRFPLAWNKSHISWHQEPESGVRISISNLLFCNESTGVSQLLGCLGLKMSSTIWCKGAYSYPLAWEYMNGVAYFISDFGWWFRNLNSCPLHPLHPFDCPHVRHWAARLPDSGEP